MHFFVIKSKGTRKLIEALKFEILSTGMRENRIYLNGQVNNGISYGQ